MRACEIRLAAAILASLTVLLAGCGGRGASADNSVVMFTDNGGLLSVPANSPLRSHLVVQTVETGDQPQRLDLPAAVETDPTRTTNILAPLSGRVVDLRVRLGDRVARGEVLAVIASGDLAQADSDLEKAQDAYNLAEKALQRALGVQHVGGAATKDIEAAESGEVQARSELDRAKARLVSLNGSARASGGRLVLTAPRSGVVTSLSISSGAQVSDPTASLLTVTNIDRVFVTANVAEDDIGKIRLGTPADVALTAYPGRAIHGAVSEIDALVQSDTRRQKVRIELANPGERLLPNMYATATFDLPAAGAGQGQVFVPQSALLMNNDAISVFVEVRPWVFQRRAVQIGDETDTAAHVLSGLRPGERVVVRGGVLLND